MPRLQSQLALYGAIDEAVVESRDPAVARIVEKFLPGTTGFGQRGWYREALGFLDNLTAPGRRLIAPDLDTARADLTDGARQDDGLPAAVTARAILAEVVLQNIARVRGGAHLSTLGPLSDILAAAPRPASSTTPSEPGTLGDDAGAELAKEIQDSVSNLAEFRAFMDRQSDETIAAAVASYSPNAFLRKVRGEYCSVITTDATWTDVDFGALLRIVDPQNWDDIYGGFFCSMTLRGETAQGWSAVVEEVSGDCGQYSMTTPLKFWKQHHDDQVVLNYDLDEASTADVDHFVLVDNGYIWITRLTTGGVRLRTSKELLIRGLSSTATIALAGGLGWADNASDMFRHGAQLPIDDPVAFTNSTRNAAAKQGPQSSFPIDPPVLPPDIRAEGVDDTVDILKGSIASLAGFGTEFVSRWSDGVDREDLQRLGTDLGAIATERSVALFDAVSSNFRPAPIPRQSVQEEHR